MTRRRPRESVTPSPVICDRHVLCLVWRGRRPRHWRPGSTYCDFAKTSSSQTADLQPNSGPPERGYGVLAETQIESAKVWPTCTRRSILWIRVAAASWPFRVRIALFVFIRCKPIPLGLSYFGATTRIVSCSTESKLPEQLNSVFPNSRTANKSSTSRRCSAASRALPLTPAT